MTARNATYEAVQRYVTNLSKFYFALPETKIQFLYFHKSQFDIPVRSGFVKGEFRRVQIPEDTKDGLSGLYEHTFYLMHGILSNAEPPEARFYYAYEESDLKFLVTKHSAVTPESFYRWDTFFYSCLSKNVSQTA